jgi:hypothetical protein
MEWARKSLSQVSVAAVGRREHAREAAVSRERLPRFGRAGAAAGEDLRISACETESIATTGPFVSAMREALTPDYK